MFHNYRPAYGYYPRHQTYQQQPQQHSYASSLEDEERAALAHLHDIQRRREEEQFHIREAAKRQIEREFAIKQALHEAYLERQRAEQVAHERAVAKEVARQKAELERQRQFELWQARRAAQKEQYERFIAEKKRRWIEHVKAQQAKAAYRNGCARACARRCEGPCAKPDFTEQAANDNAKQPTELEQINRWLGLFGVQLVDGSEKKEEVTEKKDEAPAATEATPVATETTQPAPIATQSEVTPPEYTAAEPAKTTPETEKPNVDDKSTQPKPFEFGQDLNDLIYNFFGVKLEPAKEGEKSAPGLPAGLEGLNDFLSQFGVYFEPDAPTTEGKGKGVAAGEKTEAAKETPTPAESTSTTSSVESIAKLDHISQELNLVKESFTFPSKLSFSTSETPTLLFNKTNSSYHAQANKLLQLLLAADGISSGGDKDVREKRKEVVRNVEAEIEGLEKKRDEAFEQSKVRRENGEESEDEGWGSSSNDGASETHFAETVRPTEVESAPSEVVNKSNEAAGYEVTHQENVENAENVENDRLDADETTDTQPLIEKDAKEDEHKDKDDEYELL